ncbi:MAG: hypothetical protein BGO19_11570, partial [Acinetobacter sp. 38-8]
MKKLVLGLGLSLTVLAGCTSIMPHSDQTKVDAAQSLSVEFLGQDTYNVVQQQGTVRLYAVENRMADVPATLITQKKIQVSQVPFTVDLNIPANHRQNIQPSVRDNAELNYYITWEPDVKNLTGKDLIAIDYDRKFPAVSLNKTKQQIYLRQ